MQKIVITDNTYILDLDFSNEPMSFVIAKNILSVTIVEKNPGTLIHLEIPDNCTVQYISNNSIQKNTIRNITVGANAILELHELNISSGNILVTNILLAGAGAQANLYHGFIVQSQDTLDIAQHITHDAPNTISQIVSQGVVNNGAVLNYNPKVTVTLKGTTSQAKQIVHILKTETSKVSVNTIPQLDITSDHVTCSHGASVTPISHDVIHQLTSRGIDTIVAKQLIIKNHVYKYISKLL